MQMRKSNLFDRTKCKVQISSSMVLNLHFTIIPENKILLSTARSHQDYCNFPILTTFQPYKLPSSNFTPVPTPKPWPRPDEAQTLDLLNQGEYTSYRRVFSIKGRIFKQCFMTCLTNESFDSQRLNFHVDKQTTVSFHQCWGQSKRWRRVA